jgi:hypothetical protein
MKAMDGKSSTHITPMKNAYEILERKPEKKTTYVTRVWTAGRPISK